MDYIKGLPLAPHRCRSAPHQLPLATAVCTARRELHQESAKLDRFSADISILQS
ncbi:MAG: hypothetical protein MR837_02665 [Firmicutes bacterium]|nr:hypothetical protein [Bacillota bacterium]